MNNSDLLHNYITYLNREVKKSKNTVIAYSRDIEHALDRIGSDAKSITPKQLTQYLDHLEADLLLSPKTVSRKLNSLKNFYRYLIREKVISKNPAKEISGPTIQRKAPRFLNKDERMKLRNGANEDIRIYTLIELIFQTGLQIGEIIELRPKDIDFTGGKFLQVAGREIPLNNKIRFVLQGYVAEFHSSPNSLKPLFYTSTGNALHVRNIRAEIDTVLRDARLSSFTVNDLRNTFIVAQLEAGLDIKQVAQLVGHKTLKSTERYLACFEAKPTQFMVENIVEV